MADANITVDWNELDAKGQSMVSEAGNMETILLNMKTEVKGLSQYWESNASTEMLTHIEKFQETIDRYKQVVNDYGEFLKTASSTYSSTEQTVTNAANNLYFQ